MYLLKLVFVFACVCGLIGRAIADDAMPGTRLLSESEPLDEVMVAGINRFAVQEIAAARKARRLPDAGSADRFRKLIGAIDQRVDKPIIEFVATSKHPSRVGVTDTFTIDRVRWPVLQGVTAEGLWLRPNGEPIARVIAIPDADWTPEMIAGIHPSPTNFATDLTRLGCEVLVPTLINREHPFSANPSINRSTNLSHREFIYRQAFEVGRHVIGYEVQKILAAVDYFAAQESDLDSDDHPLPIMVFGAGEGGLLALYSGAIDDRIRVTVVSGYFDNRSEVWREPIYRNVWRLLTEFGDAELAAMIAPRSLWIESASQIPEVTEPMSGPRMVAAPGKILVPRLQRVESEIQRARKIVSVLDPSARDWLQTIGESGHAPLPAPELSRILSHELAQELPPAEVSTLESVAVEDDQRQKRQVDQLVEFTQRILRTSHRERDRRFAAVDRSSLAAFKATVEPLRDTVYEQLIGRLPNSFVAPDPRSRKIFDEPDYVGFEVVLDVFPDVIAAGVLLLPNSMKEDEQRPVVVCQHGLEGTPMHTITSDPAKGYRSYKAFAVELVKRGFIVYAPQNPYRGQDQFRAIQRKSNPLGRSLFSYIIPQHQVTLRWLASLPNVDRDRIAFYGLSYGGKTAMRVPPFLVPSDDDPGYCLSICSADFNEWVSKNASVDVPFSYVWTGEYEIFEWNMAHVANYAELAMLISPRPFMVERGHDDGVGLDEWVAWEYAKVRRHYNKLGIGGRTEIEFFDGPHTINGQATYRFLHRHLNWPLGK